MWAHQSLTPRGFRWFIIPTVLLLTLPLFAVLGTPTLWVLLAYFIIAVSGVWRAIMVNRSQRQVREELEIAGNRIHLVHRPPAGSALEWEANPYWVRVNLRPKGGPVEDYLTLSGGGREVELGSFLVPEERRALKGELETTLARLN